MGILSLSEAESVDVVGLIFVFFFCVFLIFCLVLQNGFKRRLEESFHELRQSREKRRSSPGARQQELDQDGQRLRPLQQNLLVHRRRHHIPKVLRKQGQAHQLRHLPKVHRRIGDRQQRRQDDRHFAIHGRAQRKV